MTPIIHTDSNRAGDAGRTARTTAESSTLDGKRYKLNPGFARNSWLQPYVLQES